MFFFGTVPWHEQAGFFPTVDFTGLGLITLKLGQANITGAICSKKKTITGAIDYMNQVLGQPLDPAVKSAVSRCMGLYSRVGPDLKGHNPYLPYKALRRVQNLGFWSVDQRGFVIHIKEAVYSEYEMLDSVKTKRIFLGYGIGRTLIKGNQNYIDG
ncbi:hypothetical protein NL676_022387 [Syzygium grande]|nr:hypothetical protein NL676_022387 [Syzygium grande]